MAGERSPRDTFVTVYGRMPVLAAVSDENLRVDKVVVAYDAHGPSLDAILQAARRRKIAVRRASAHRVKVLAGNGRHDQGVLADVVAPRMASLDEFLAARTPDGGPAALFVLDRVINPGNVGMIVRAATAAGIDGIVVPHAGTADLGPLTIKASAGVVFRAPVLRCWTAVDGLARLRQSGFTVYGLAGGRGTSLYRRQPFAEAAAFVLGNETTGVGDEAGSLVDEWVSIPMHNDVESLNVSSVAAVLAFELARRRAIR